MYPGTYAARTPDRIAAVMTGSGETLSYGDLERRSVQLAHALYEAGLRAGDVAVIGLPDPEMGESVAAFIQPAAGAVPGPRLEQEIIAYVKSKIASFKAPRTIRFVEELPGSEAGKLMKSQLKAMYAHGEATAPRPVLPRAEPRRYHHGHEPTVRRS